MVLFHAERHTTQSNFEFETTATFEACCAVPLVPPAREDMLGHARTHTPAQTRSIHKHDRSAGARAHMQGRAGWVAWLPLHATRAPSQSAHQRWMLCVAHRW
jgi:hypothetical protein